LDNEIVERAVDRTIEPLSTPALSLEVLPQFQKEAIELRYQKDLSFSEIAKHLETSPSNVRQLISRGIKKLKQIKDQGNGK
jgi:DNA-directed RNA polymerase specialized sigma subunit